MHKLYSQHRIPFYFVPLIATLFLSYPFVFVPFGITFLLFLSTFWSSRIRILFTMHKNNKKPTYIYYKNKHLSKIERKDDIMYFMCNKNIYIITTKKDDDTTKESRHKRGDKLSSILPRTTPSDVPFSILKLKPNTSHKFIEYTNYETLEYTPVKYVSLLQKNDFNYVPPSFISLFVQHIIAPLFVFQIFSSLLWCLDEYPYHALFTVVMQFIFEAGVVLSRLKNLREFGTLNLKTSKVDLLYRACNKDDKNASSKDISESRKGSSESRKDSSENFVSILSRDILPGDVISINQHSIQIPCDLLILSGSCAVNEAMLTGESIPLQKESIKEVEEDSIFIEAQHKKNILFGGTDLVKINETLKCFVLKTGFDTNQGNLIKKMMITQEIQMDKEAFYFIGCLLVFAIISSLYVIKEGFNKKDPYKLLLEVIIILTNVVPPELPMEMTIAISMALQNLLKLNVFCLEGSKIPIAGKIDVCCFDKTGTLTEIEMEMVKVVTIKDGLVEYSKGSDNKNAAKSGIKSGIIAGSVDDDLCQVVDVMAVCHSLIKIDKVRGDPLETSAFEFFSINLIDENSSEVKQNQYTKKVCKEDNSLIHKRDIATGEVLDAGQKTNLSTRDGLYTTIKKYSFSSELRRMTCVSEKNNSVFVAMKGAPESVMHYLKEVPKNYDVYKNYARKGFRIISLAMKKYKRKVEFKREEIEKDLTFVGFVLYECKIKNGTKESIKVLKESGHEVIMITGDNLMTAMNVAQKIGIIKENDCIEAGIDEMSVDKVDDNENDASLGDNLGADHFCGSVGVEGEAIDRILESKEFYGIKVFARADPLHKEKIIKKYKDNGKVTLMCGDGTNDVGALKLADVGVALVENNKSKKKRVLKSFDEDLTVKLGDASVAAPFTAKTGSINAVLDIIRQGRSTLVTTIQMYKILALNSLISAYSFSVLDIIGIKYGEVQMTISGILIAFAFMFLTKSKTLKSISKERPVDNIFNKYVIFSIISQTIIHILSFIILLNSGVRNNVIKYHNEGFGMKSAFFDTKYIDYELQIYSKDNQHVKDNERDNKHMDATHEDDINDNKLDLSNENKASSEKFKPSTLNSAIFILSVSQQINTFIVNYIGRPFRESFMENSYLRNCLFCVSAIMIGVILEINESFSRLMEIVPLNSYKYMILAVVAFDFITCFVCEKICFNAFLL